MFCKNCGAELPDNAKFCRMCGAKLADQEQPAPEPSPISAQEQEVSQPLVDTVDAVVPEPIPEQRVPEPVPVQEQIPQPSPVIPPYTPQMTEQPAAPAPMPSQPYAPNYQQPMAQPYIPAPGQQVPVGSVSSKALGLFISAICIFLACTVFIKVFAVGRLDYSVYSFVDTMNKSASMLNKSVFSFTADVVSRSEWYSAPFYIALWVDLLFALLSVIMLVFAFIRVCSNSQSSELKMWSNLKASALFSFIGSLLMIASILLANIAYNVIHNKDIFENWGMEPSVFAYLFLVLELVMIIFCGVWKKKAKKALRAQTPAEPVQALPPNNL